jgi:ribosome-associated toxin RatA of RatAB toxin-antitoxin module
MRSTLSIDVQAPPELVFKLARDIERWPALLPHYLRVRVVERHPDGSLSLEMVAIRVVVRVIGLGLPVVWRARTWNDPAALGLRFVHRGGATARMDVTWRIERQAKGSRVSIDHDFRPNLPAPVGWAWATFIDRLFVRPIATRTLAAFKTIAEVTADIEERWSDSANPANPSS